MKKSRVLLQISFLLFLLVALSASAFALDTALTQKQTILIILVLALMLILIVCAVALFGLLMGPSFGKREIYENRLKEGRIKPFKEAKQPVKEEKEEVVVQYKKEDDLVVKRGLGFWPIVLIIVVILAFIGISYLAFVLSDGGADVTDDSGDDMPEEEPEEESEEDDRTPSDERVTPDDIEAEEEE